VTHATARDFHPTGPCPPPPPPPVAAAANPRAAENAARDDDDAAIPRPRRRVPTISMPIVVVVAPGADEADVDAT